MSRRKRSKGLPPGTQKRPSDWNFPPDIFWINPDGVIIEVIGHLSGIQARPQAFGLHRAPVSKADVDKAFRQLFEAGWVRGRYSNGFVNFQMERPRGLSLSGAHEFVAKYRSWIDRVAVDFTGPFLPKELTAEDFLDQRFPSAWGINPPRRRG